VFVKTRTIHELNEKPAATLPGGFPWVNWFHSQDRRELLAAPFAKVFVIGQKRKTTSGSPRLLPLPENERVKSRFAAFCAVQ
jgi:hypothetical protein